MKEEYKDFVGIYDESVPVELCNEFVTNYEEAKKNRTVIDMTNPENELGISESATAFLNRKDEVVFVAPLYSTIYPKPPVDAYFKFLQECFKCYVKRYCIWFDG